MVCRRPGIVSSYIKRQTHGFAESPFVIFENLRARKMSHDFLVGGSGRASFAHYAFRSGTSNRVSHITARMLKREPSQRQLSCLKPLRDVSIAKPLLLNVASLIRG